jgi:hypothetical protein
MHRKSTTDKFVLNQQTPQNQGVEGVRRPQGRPLLASHLECFRGEWHLGSGKIMATLALNPERSPKGLS